MHVTIVLVLYNQSIEACKTLQSLHRIFSGNGLSCQNGHLVIYDNSEQMQAFDKDKYSWIESTYFHNPQNPGIATAYNYALQKANHKNSDWLVLLDDDTCLTEKYADLLLVPPAMKEDVVAAVPKVKDNGIQISPVFSDSLRPLQLERPAAGIQNKPVMAINSGSFLRVTFLNEIHGFNENFPLDYLDHWLFYEIYARNYKVEVFDIVLKHELSVMDYRNVSLKRYQNIINAEILFYKQFHKELFPFYRKQLIKRLFKQMVLVKNKKIALCTLKKILSL
ncbi:glycosyltransferase [Bacillaceae bacterium Marseille-Q3522]|nr:glycosyltransferase [Bacillaceae bacterium Marseille-Q3522]